MEYITHSPEETAALGARLAEKLEPGVVVAFTGDLGAGRRPSSPAWPGDWASRTG